MNEIIQPLKLLNPVCLNRPEGTRYVAVTITLLSFVNRIATGHQKPRTFQTAGSLIK